MCTPYMIISWSSQWWKHTSLSSGLLLVIQCKWLLSSYPHTLLKLTNCWNCLTFELKTAWQNSSALDLGFLWATRKQMYYTQTHSRMHVNLHMTQTVFMDILTIKMSSSTVDGIFACREMSEHKHNTSHSMHKAWRMPKQQDIVPLIAWNLHYKHSTYICTEGT